MKSFFILSCILVFLAGAVPYEAPAGTNGILEGIVKDKKTGEVLPGVTVVLVGLQRGTATGPDGRFELQNIRAGTYDVRVSHVGYRPSVLKGVIINPDLRTRLAIALEPSDVALDEIVVTLEKPLIQTDITGTTFIVSGEDVKALPVNNVFDIVGFKAGTTTEGNVRGGKSSEVMYYVDGLPVQDLMGGGSALSVPKSSVLGMSILTGGFEPEYGNALSGIVNIVTRSGGTDHNAMLRADRDNLFGGTQVNRESQFEGFASGPVIADRLWYIGVISGSVSDTRWWQDFRGIIKGPIEQNVNALAKIDYALTPTMRLGAHMLYGDKRRHEYDFAWRYNLPGLPPERKRSSRLAAILSHSITESFFYTASLSRYSGGTDIGDGAREEIKLLTPYMYDFYLRYVVDGQRAWWTRSTQETYTAKVDGILKMEKAHLLKFGAEMNYYNLHSDIIRFEPRRTYFGKPLVNEPQLDFSSSYAYAPRSGSVYLQDKVDLPDEGILLNFGARFDFLDPRAERPAIEATLQGDTAYAFKPGQLVKADSKYQFSPRFGAAIQASEHGYVFVNLGWYMQFPLFDYLYTGLDRVALGRGVAAITGNQNLEPERSKLWEISFKYSMPENLVASATYYRKETSNLVDAKTFISGDSKLAGNYGFAEYVNTPFAESQGIELVLSRERGEWITGEISYTYMTAEGTSGSASDGYYIAQYGLPPGVRVYPLSWDQRHSVKAITTINTPWDLAITSVVQWHTGRPYTRYPTATGFDRVVAGNFHQNNDRMPAFVNVDIRVEKKLRLPWWGEASAALYCESRNLSDGRNVRWMDSNGRIGGELGDPGGYFIGRRTCFGVLVSF